LHPSPTDHPTRRGAIHKTLRQVLHFAVRVKLLVENPATLVPNPEPKRREVPTFESVSQLVPVSEELHPTFAPIPLFARLTGSGRRSGSRSNAAT
jgi:hypothetical protein